jgi:hypothetical protein
VEGLQKPFAVLEVVEEREEEGRLVPWQRLWRL